MNKKRSRRKPARQLLPAAAAFAVAGILIGGGGLVIRFGAPAQGAGIDVASSYEAADYPPADRDAQASRATRDEVRPSTAPTAAPTVPGPAVAQAPTANTNKSKSPLLGNGSVIATGSCETSFYDEPQKTANGETFDPSTLTAAHKTLPFNTRVRVTNVANGSSVVVRINDRGPFVSGRCLDLSRAAFGTIASLRTGVVDVRYEVLGASGM